MPRKNPDEAAQYNRERRAWYAEHYICSNCGQREPVPGRKFCNVCIAHYKALRLNTTDRDNARRKELREQRKAMGLCIQCGKVAVPGKTMCNRCRMQRNDSVRKYRIRGRIDKEVEALVKRSRINQPSDQAAR